MSNLTKFNCETTTPLIGITSCDASSMGAPVSILLLKQGTEIALNSTFFTAFKDEVKKAKILPFPKFTSNEQQSEENVTITSDLGIESLVRDGLPKYTLTFEEGICFHRELYKVNSNPKGWSFVFVYENGFFGKVENDTFSGFDLSNAHVATLMLGSGSDVQKTMLTIQVESAFDLNTKGGVVYFANVTGGNPKNVKGIVQLSVGLTEVDSTHLRAIVKTACSGAEIVGLTSSKISLALNSISAVTETAPGDYSITISGTMVTGSEVLTIKETGFNCSELLGTLYGGQSSPLVIS